MSQPVRINSAFGEDLLFKSMELSEELGRLFRCEIDLYSPKQDLELDDVLGHDLTIEMDLPREGTRFFHGFVTEIAHTGQSGGFVSYTATLRPWFWFLSRASNCRIFQNMKVPDIVKQVFRDAGFSDFRESLSATYRTWEYCVQYRETDFNFVSRLLEQEGIYYFFEHENGKHTLVLADSPQAHGPIKGYEKIPYYPPSSNAERPEHVFDWTLMKSVRTGSYRLNAFLFKKPKMSLEVDHAIAFSHPHGKLEYFDYPGEHYEKSEGKRYATVRMEELAAQHERVRGQTDAMGLFPGGLFELSGHPRSDQNREYLVLSTRHHLTIGGYESGGSSGDYEYSCGFEAMPSDIVFRAERTTPRPVMQGPQTAIVCGKSGEEIDTDEFGRVKVQFRWDRKGKNDENSSCWIRVSQAWAGGQWGGMTIPRIGQEVVVDFIEGDPDRPIVTGRVYNGDNMPPYALPGAKTQSGLKSRSTKGGSGENFNEIRFEDKKGEEEMYVHAEKDQNVLVENNQNILVGGSKKDPGNRKLTVHNDEQIGIGHDRTMTVGRDKTETVGRDKSIQVAQAHSESVGKNMTINVGSSLTETVAINYAETVGAAMELTVGGALTVSVGASLSETVAGMRTESVGAGQSVTIGGDLTEKVGKSKKVTIEKDFESTVNGLARTTVKKEFELTAKKIQLIAQDELSIKVGSAQMTLKKNGDITISGKKIDIKGSGDVIVKGSKIQEN
jgi:type VI secretion system secreted protein VgrG